MLLWRGFAHKEKFGNYSRPKIRDEGGGFSTISDLT